MPAAAIAAKKKVTPSDEWFSGLQWSLDAIDAEGGWDEGLTGAGVRACVLDSGIQSNHGDLAANLNKGLSASFIAGEAYDMVRTSNHGTHVAGILAAADNNYGTIGIAPDAEIVAIKVLSANTGSGSFFGILQGVVYAADIGCDVANMSLSGSFVMSGGTGYTARDAAGMMSAMTRASNYAEQQGTLLVASAGNGGMDVDVTKSLVIAPAMLPHVVAVSALGPQGWALDDSEDLDVQAIYTNIGTTIVHHSGPGGNIDLALYDAFFANPGNPDNWCTVDGVTVPCWVFDMVLAPIPVEVAPGVYVDNWSWKAGTSMSAPAVAGVAALICEDLGSKCTPAAIRARLGTTSTDLGKSGMDKVHGLGRVDAYEAVK